VRRDAGGVAGVKDMGREVGGEEGEEGRREGRGQTVVDTGC
jgi:hypothetical protein